MMLKPRAAESAARRRDRTRGRIEVMSDQTAHNFPRAPLIGAALLVVGVVSYVAIARLTGNGAQQLPTGTAIVSRDLRFEDLADGSIAVQALPSETTIDVVAPGTNGFIRGSLRALSRVRKLEDTDPKTPFRLTAWNDGRLTLEDTSTGRRVDLEAFGATNEQAYARLLTLPVPGGVSDGAKAAALTLEQAGAGQEHAGR